MFNLLNYCMTIGVPNNTEIKFNYTREQKSDLSQKIMFSELVDMSINKIADFGTREIHEYFMKNLYIHKELLFGGHYYYYE